MCCFDDPSPSQRVTHTTGMTHLKVIILQTELRCSKLYITTITYVKAVPCSCISENLIYQLPGEGAITPKHVGGLINYTTVYVVCECLGLTKRSKYTFILQSGRKKLKLYSRVFRSSGFHTGQGKIKGCYGSTDTRNEICSQLNSKTDRPH